MHHWLPLNNIGIIAAMAVALTLLHRYRSARRQSRLPRYATAGAVILIGGQYFTLLGVGLVTLFFTPIAWTGYILWVDGAVYALRGRSLLKTAPAEFAWLAACSIPLWLIFEAYNLRLDNWIYIGLPQEPVARWLGYIWAFATIWPAIFETAALLRALDSTDVADELPNEPARSVSRFATVFAACCGAAFLIVPLLAPPSVGAYLFGAVWVGFIFLLEPLNLRAGRASLWGDLLRSEPSRLRALLWAGFVCGVFWEFWNYWATAQWFYTVPILPEEKIFAMPLPGYLGFPAFAVECFAMLAFAAPYVSAMARRLGGRELSWQSLQL